MLQNKQGRLSGAILTLSSAFWVSISSGVDFAAMAQSDNEQIKAQISAIDSKGAETGICVRLLQVILLQDEKETFQAAASDKVGAFIRTVQNAADNYFAGQDRFDTKQLIVKCTVKPGEPPVYGLTTKPGLSGKLTAGLDLALSAVPKLEVNSPISMEIIFAVADNDTKIGAQAKKLIRAGKAADAIDLLTPMVTEDCKNAFLWQQLGWAYCARGDFSAAEKTLKRALELDPRDFDTWANLVSTYHSEGKVKEAEDAARKNLDCAQDEESTDLVKINNALYAGDWPKAEIMLRKQCRKNAGEGAEAPYQVILACALRWQGKNDEAQKLLEEALKHDLDDYYAKLAAKQLALLKGDWTTAEELGRKDLSKDPKDYESLYDMGVALKGEGKIDEARRAFEAALQPVTPKSVSEAVHLQMKDLTQVGAKSNIVKE